MYDTIVIGNDLSSMIAALASLRQGLKTALLSDGGMPDVYPDSGFSFNINPYPLTGPDREGLLLHPFQQDIFFDPLRSFVAPLDPGLQIILQNHRLDIFSLQDGYLREYEREFAGCGLKLEKLYEAASAASTALLRLMNEFPALRPGSFTKAPRFLGLLSAYRSEKSKFLRRFKGIQNGALKGILQSQMALLSGQHHADCTHLPRHLYLTLQGMCYPLGGKNALWRALRDLFVSRGGIYFNDCAIHKITSTPERCGVEWRKGDEPMTASAEHVIASVEWMNIDILWASHKRLHRCARYFGHDDTALHPFTLHLGVHDCVIPEKMVEHVLLLKDDVNPLSDQNFIYLEVSKRGDVERAPTGKRALSATVFLEKSPASLPDSDLHEAASKLIQNMEGFLPFLMERIDVYDLTRCVDLSRKGREYVRPKYRARRNFFSSFSSLSNRTPLKSVILTGGELLTELGFEGEVLSGINAALLASGGDRR